MTEAEWLASEDPMRLLEWHWDRATPRQLRLFSCGCCRRIWGQVTAEEARRCVEVAEEFADGRATDGQRARAYTALGRAAERESGRWWYAVVECAEKGLTKRLAPLGAHAAQAGAGPPTADRPDPVAAERAAQAMLLRDILRNPFRPVSLDQDWRTPTVAGLAAQMYDSRDFCPMPILADALQDAGCDSEDILNHCRGPGPHVRGCWVLDLVLGKE